MDFFAIPKALLGEPPPASCIPFELQHCAETTENNAFPRARHTKETFTSQQ
jgi:hypothetical protein